VIISRIILLTPFFKLFIGIFMD